MTTKRFLLAAPLMLAAMPAVAHTGIHEPSGLIGGFLHPLGGLDHALAMLAVGLLASLLGGRAIWSVPASFVIMMLVGAVIGLHDIKIPATEIGIVASVVILGFAVAWGRPFLTSVAMALTGVFAIFHGYAHGAEMPVETSAVLYCLGFALSTTLLHGTGLMVGLAARAHPPVIRLTGAAVGIAGLVLSLG